MAFRKGGITQIKPPNLEIVDVFNSFALGLTFPNAVQFSPDMPQRRYEAFLQLSASWQAMEVQIREHALKQPKL